MKNIDVKLTKKGTATICAIRHIPTGLFILNLESDLKMTQKKIKSKIAEHLSMCDWDFAEEEIKSVSYMRDKIDAVQKLFLDLSYGIAL